MSGGTAADNRLFVEAVLFRFRAGVPWRNLPERFGDWKIVYQRFNRWAKSGVFERVFRLLASDHDNEYMMIDATIVRAHQHSTGAQKKTARRHWPIPRRIDHQEIHALVDALGNPVEMMLSPGQDHDLTSTEISHRSRRSRGFDRRQGVRRRRLHRRPRRSSHRPSHPIQIQPKNPALLQDFALANAISLSVSSTSSSISGPSPRVTTSSPRFSSPAFSWPAPPSSSTEDTSLHRWLVSPVSSFPACPTM